MTDDTTVNSQITDTVAQTVEATVGLGPAHGVDVAIQALAHAMGLAMQNASLAQGAMQQINNAAVAALISQMT